MEVDTLFRVKGNGLDMFRLKKIAAAFIYPTPMCLEFLLLGVFLLLFTRRQTLGKVLVCIGTLLLFTFSFPLFPGLLLHNLEGSYQVLQSQENGAQWIVVLGAGGFCDPNAPIGNQVSAEGLFRLIEGVRLHKELPGSKLIFTGPAAPKMSRIAVVCGVAQDDILMLSRERDTEEESLAVKSLLGGEKLILVTSASHLPRATALFEKQGMHPVPAPAEYAAKKACQDEGPPMPGPYALDLATKAFHEYLGLFWARINGKI